jgi:homocysteine S-methyltransferase
VSDPFLPFLARRGAVLLDGGLATELERRGVDLPHPLWSARALLDAPEAVAAVHRDYLDAGADVVTTATYQAPVSLVARGVELARRERDAFVARSPAGRPRPLVAASIGPYGASLADGSEYRGGYGLGVEALMNWHRPRLRELEESGADVLAFETIPSLAEVEAIARLLAERDGPPAWISFQARDVANLAEGTGLAEASSIADRAPRVLAIGVNCVAPEQVEPMLRTLGTATRKHLAAYPNRGDTWDPRSRRWIPRARVVDFAALSRTWRAAGAALIGGCCRTTPADVASML